MGNFFSDTWKDLTQPGWKQQEKALKAAQTSEARSSGIQDELLALGRSMLYGQQGDPSKAGTAAGTTWDNSQATAGNWMSKYLDYLEKSPDLTYNKQRTAFERGYKDSMNNISDTMNARGLGKSGLLGKALGTQGFERAQGLSSLLGEKEARRGANLEQGANVTQNLLNRALNFMSTAGGNVAGSSSIIPQLYAQMAGQSGGSNAISDLLGAIVQDQLSKSNSGASSAAKKSGSALGAGATSAGGSVLSSAAKSLLFKAIGL